MNATRTVIMAMIVAFAMIGMTGLAMADPNGNGDFGAWGDTSGYSAEYSGTGGGVVNINTYTDDGRDHKTITYNANMEGGQSMSLGSTAIVRYDEINGGGVMTTYSRDNADAIVTTRIASNANTKLYQEVLLTDAEDDCVSSYMMGAANGQYSIGTAAYTDEGAKRVTVALSGNGHGEMDAGAFAGYGIADILFGVGDIPRPFGGQSHGGTNGVGTLRVTTHSDEGLGLGVYGPSTYTFTSRPGSMVYVAPFNGNFGANGYVYAVDLP